VPVVPVGVLILNQGWLDGVSISSPGALSSAVNYISDPVVNPIVDVLPEGLLFAGGIATLIGAFTVFDRALPQLEAPGERIEKLSRTLQHRYAMFLFGTLVTLITLSVSLSVTILVPLALKGYVHRDRVIPYVMGANIATWIDTLFAALLLNSPQSFTIVLTMMVTGSAVSLSVLFFLYGPYNRVIHGAAHRVSSSRRHMIAFLVALLAAPMVLIGTSAALSMI
jgi:Na+/phosphate symporter